MTLSYIVEVVEKVPQKKMQRESKLGKVLGDLYEAVDVGKTVRFDPILARVQGDSLRYQLRIMIRQGAFSKGTKISSRGVGKKKEWYYTKGIRA